MPRAPHATALALSTMVISSLVTTGLVAPAWAQPTRQPSAAEIAKRLQKLSVLGSVLYVAAHPDDENTSLLTYLANGKMVRAAYLSMTRGDGGQNLIGSEQGVALGVIRTQELLAARRTDGAEQMFTRARDFGYSKSVEESLEIWGGDEVLADMVTVIRRFRPDLIITRFSPTGGGHGHHTASAQLAGRAFKLAADASYQPAGQPKLAPWQARRLLVNRGGTEGNDLRLDVGSYDPLLGQSYGEISAESRSMHKSQGFGSVRRRGPQIESFDITAEAPGSKPASKGAVPFEGIDWTWARVPGSDRVAKLAAEVARAFRPEAPAGSLPALAALDAALAPLEDRDARPTAEEIQEKIYDVGRSAPR
ncbi:MAG TPA: PIG-L family deacetylase, partial [Polyangia bacterium]